MENYTSAANKISEYMELSRKIKLQRDGLSSKKREISSEYELSFARLKKGLSEYISKIKQTVETVCNLYKGKIILVNGKIKMADGSVPIMKYTPSQACDLGIKAGNEGVKYLSNVIKRISVESNLKELALCYNTVVDIYEGVDRLQALAIDDSISAYTREIDDLESKRNSLCKDKDELNKLVECVLRTSDDLYKRVMIENKLEMENSFNEEIRLSLGYETCKGDFFEKSKDLIISLLEWELHKDGIALIRGSDKDLSSRKTSRAVVNTIIKFLFAYPTKNKQILLCDSYSNEEITTFAGVLRNISADMFFDNSKGSFVKNSDEEINTSVCELNRIINERIMVLGQSKCNNILEYNKKNKDNPQPIILALLNGYPNKYDGVGDVLSSALKNGKKAGVFFLITECTDEDEEKRYFRKKMPNLGQMTTTILEFKQIDNKPCLIKDEKCYLANTCGENYDISLVLSAFKHSAKSNLGQTVYLESVVNDEDFESSKRRTEFSKRLSIPIGKQGSVPVNLDLCADGPTAHLAVIGTTGSGKTAFINTLVLSASRLYSPSELELHLIVMVKGDFEVFKDEKLPHLKTVVTGDKTLSANDVLDFLNAEMLRRKKIMNNQDIYVYNKTASKPMPRCIVIIDEFSELVKDSSDAIDQIERIARMGRSFGISLVASSTSFPMETNAIKHLMGNRIEFKSAENAGQLIPDASSRQSELNNAKGSCFYYNGSSLYSVRVAYSEEGDELKKRIASVRNKYSGYEMKLQSEIKARLIESEGDAPFSTKDAKREYAEEGVIRMRLGSAYLSNKAVEYPFDYENNVLFLFGHYLETKSVEVSLIKDTLVLSKNIDKPTVFYIDLNKNKLLSRQSTIIKRVRDNWILSGKMVCAGPNEAEEVLDEIRNIISERENDEDCDLYPILVMISRGEELFEDDDKCDEICELISKGKENNIYFAIQCNGPVKFFGSDKYVRDAIVFPDRSIEGESYSSSGLCSALEELPAGLTERGKKLIFNATMSSLDKRLHLLCNNNNISVFIPYEYDEGYLTNLID